MMVLDTSALMALLLSEPESDEIAEVLSGEEPFVISAGTLSEALIVAKRRGVRDELAELLDAIGVEVEVLDAAKAVAVADAYAKWGKGAHAAGLNFGDCFAYVAAKANNLPLLYIGDDFAKTDVLSARAGSA